MFLQTREQPTCLHKSSMQTEMAANMFAKAILQTA